jgi:hypothetical protein
VAAEQNQPSLGVDVREATRPPRRRWPEVSQLGRTWLSGSGGTAPAGLTVSCLTQALPHAWTAQEQMLGHS